MPARRDRNEAVKRAEPGSDWAKMVALLRYADFAEVGRALGRTPSAVHKWYWGKNVGPDQVRRVEELLGKQKEAARPEWAERLLTGVMALERHHKITDAQIEAARAQALAAVLDHANTPSKPPQSGGGASGAQTSSKARP